MRIMYVVFAIMLPVNLFAASYEQAIEAASYLGIISSDDYDSTCKHCHNMGDQQMLERWARRTENAYYDCLSANAGLSAKETLNCLARGDGAISAADLGFFTLKAKSEQFRNLYLEAYPEDGERRFKDQMERLSMPMGQDPLDNRIVNKILSWSIQGMPYLDEILSPYDGPETCTTSLRPELLEHLEQMSYLGWGAKNQENSIKMFGCDQSNPLTCFSQQRDGTSIFKRPSEFGIDLDLSGRTVVLHKFPAKTDYWIRSSADGRFIAYGGSPSMIVDLRSKLSSPGLDRLIEVDAYYDPGFFPDNSAFMFQGARTGICQQSLLENPATRKVSFREEQCVAGDAVSTPLYQAVGTSLDLEDYLAVTGSFVSDSGQIEPDLDASYRPNYSPQASVALHPFIFDGQSWQKQTATEIATPWQVDWNLSPSNRLLVSRLVASMQGKTKHLGYYLYRSKRMAGNQGFTYELESLGMFCVPGLKGKFSFDERFFVTYDYIREDQWQELGFDSPSDQAFRALLNERSSQLFLVDFLNQSVHSLNSPKSHSRLMFPHFRSDGWIYFMYHNDKTGDRYLMANDSALRSSMRFDPSAGH